jgi:phenylpyruvate tautomerase PptA (4-oxalocrotonate tautomerase family)
MPLVRITVVEGTPAETRRALGEGVHRALVECAGVPKDDRFQVIETAAAPDLVWDPAYLGIARTGVVLVQIFLNQGRTVEVKSALYARIAEAAEAAGVPRSNVLVNLVEVARENWSFGDGKMSYPPGK